MAHSRRKRRKVKGPEAKKVSESGDVLSSESLQERVTANVIAAGEGD
jgi:hypothetical protein